MLNQGMFTRGIDVVRRAMARTQILAEVSGGWLVSLEKRGIKKLQLFDDQLLLLRAGMIVVTVGFHGLNGVE